MRRSRQRVATRPSRDVSVVGSEHLEREASSTAGSIGEPHVRAYEVSVERVPGPYVAETFPVHVEDGVVKVEVT